MTEENKPAEEPKVGEETSDMDEMNQLLMELDSLEDEVGVSHEDAPEPEPAPETEQTAEPEYDDLEPLDDDKVVEEEETESVVDSDEYQKALVALRRDGLPQSVIDQMTEQQVAEYGQKRMKVQSDTDNAYRELKDLQTTNAESVESPTESQPDTTPEPEAPVADNLKEAMKPFAELFGEEAANALGAYQEAVVQPAVQQLQNQVQFAMQAVETMALEKARTELSGTYPDLASDEGYAKVQGRMQSLVKTGEYSDMASLMHDASRIELTAGTVPTSSETKNRLKAGAQPMPVDSAELPGKAMSADDRQSALLDALENGTDLAEASRMYGG